MLKSVAFGFAFAATILGVSNPKAPPPQRTSGPSNVMTRATARSAPKPFAPVAIEDVVIEHGSCGTGMCPQYRFEVRRDGRFTYVGRTNVAHVGAIHGRIDPRQVFDQFDHSGVTSLRQMRSGPVHLRVYYAGGSVSLRGGDAMGPLPYLRVVQTLSELIRNFVG